MCDKVCVICNRVDKLCILSELLSEKGAISLISAILTRGDSIPITSEGQYVHFAERTILANGKFSRQFKIMIPFNNVTTFQSTTKNKEFQIFHHVLISTRTAFFVEILLIFQPHTKLKILW